MERLLVIARWQCCCTSKYARKQPGCGVNLCARTCPASVPRSAARRFAHGAGGQHPPQASCTRRPARIGATAARPGAQLAAITGFDDWELDQNVRQLQAKVGSWRRIDGAERERTPAARNHETQRPRRRVDVAHAHLPAPHKPRRQSAAPHVELGRERFDHRADGVCLRRGAAGVGGRRRRAMTCGASACRWPWPGRRES